MYIDNIKINKFRHIEDIQVGPFYFNDKNTDLIVLAGPNGSGKSSILELIGYSLSNSYSLGWALSRTFNGFSFEIAIGLNQDEIKIITDSLEKEIAPKKEQLEGSIQKIKETKDLDPTVIEAQIKQQVDNFKRQNKHQVDTIDYFKTKNIYYRGFNLNDGEYGKDATFHNQVHSYVTRELKGVLKRSLGFFLRSDRHYPQKGFDRKKIFTYDSVRKKEHLWTVAFNTSEIQYQDMYEFLVQQRYHYLRELGNYYNKKNKGIDPGNEPEDPIKPYEELLNRLFPLYKFADLNESVPSNLFIEIPSGETITFNDLSSGEKEVFFILSFFIRHNVENSIIVIDEPELHLHPELSRLLIRNMSSIKNGNQIWIATHNSEIIDEAGRDKTIYVSKNLINNKAEIITGDNEEGAIEQLKNLFGFSGYIGVAKNLVFLEGNNSSPDRKFFSTLFPIEQSNFKIVPSNSCETLYRINSVALTIMESNFGFMNFFLIRDRDFLTNDMIEKYNSHSSGNVYVLPKHELENYLINFDIITVVLDEIFDIKKTSIEIKELFYKKAIDMSSDVVRDMIAFRLNLVLNPQDFNIGKILKGQSYFEESNDGIIAKTSSQTLLSDKFIEKSEQIKTSLNSKFSTEEVKTIIGNCENEVKESLKSDEWLNLFPGKELLDNAGKDLGIKNVVSLRNSIIKEFSLNRDSIHTDLKELFDKLNGN